MKTRKISKQSLVIAVLSLLLVLSMGLYATGAYFTDKATTTGANKTLTFGTINVNASFEEVVSEGTVISYEGYMVPGDHVNYTGTIDPSASTVETWVMVDLSYSVKIGGTEYAALYTEANSHDAAKKAFTVTAPTFPSTWGTATDKTTVDALGDTGKMYKIAAATPAHDITFVITLDETCPNVVYAEDSATPIYLNMGEGNNVALQNSGTALQIVITASLTVKAVQSTVAGVPLDAAGAYAKLPA